MTRRIAGLLAGAAMTAVTTLAAGTEPPLMVEADLTPAQVRVQAQAIYTLRALQGTDLRDIRLNGPQVPLADVHALGPTRVREVERGGRRYRLHERRFAILPFASGSLELTGAHVSGRLPGAAVASRWEAPARTVAVQPVPRGIAADHWLPADQLTLSETWSPDTAALPPDGTVQRSIRIEAQGVAAAQIPPLIPEIPGMRVSPLPARLENRIAAEVLIGVREQGFQLRPLQPGQVRVPALHLTWWKVGAGDTAIASLPPRTLAFGGPATEPASAPSSLPARLTTPPGPLPDSPPGETRQVMAGATGASLLLALCGAFWLGLGFRRHPLREVRRACASNDPVAAGKSLLVWAGKRWPTDPPQSLPALAARLATSDHTARALAELDRYCYGPPTHAWQGCALWRLVIRDVIRRLPWPAITAAAAAYTRAPSTAARAART
jgi:hypothetical protein